MKLLVTLLSLFLLTNSFNSVVKAQDDEARQASGLPIMIGRNVTNSSRAPLSGKITVEGLNSTEKRPTIYVIVYFTGVIIDKRLVNDKGYYYMPDVPRDGSILAVEIDNIEVGRYQIPTSAMGSLRQDLTVNWSQARNSKEKVGILSAKSFYQRTPENEKVFEKALSASREKKLDNAIKLLKQLVEQDTKDFVAWTELGTLFFKKEDFSKAEEAYLKAIEQKPDYIVALVNFGKLYLAEKQAEKAIPILTKSVEVEPDSADAQHFLGEAYLQIKKGSKAVIHLSKALELAPLEKAEIHFRLAALYHAAGLKDKAVAEYKLFLTKIPQYPEKEKIEKYIKENSNK
jgi:tetratricopeptide (TPR) repeat protein